MSRPGSDGPENVDAAFEEIVADLRAQGFGEQDLDEHAFDQRAADEPGADDHGGDRGGSGGDRGGGALLERPGPESSDGRDADAGTATGAPGSRGEGWRDSPIAWDETLFGPAPDDDDPDDPDNHFVPPEPPPLPKPRKGAVLVLVLVVLGLLLLIAPSLVGLSGAVATPLGMLSLAAGIALLLLRVRQGPPDGADPTNGAQV